MAEIIHTCAREQCGKTFTPKLKGRKRIYCSDYCRGAVYQAKLPQKQKREYWRNYYHRHLEARRASSRGYQNSLCECGNRKRSVRAKMCDDCAAMPSVNEALK